MILKSVVIRVLLIVVSFFMVVNYTVADKRVIHLVTGPDYAPYVSMELPEGGVVSEVVSRVFAEIGYKAELSFYPWNRVYQRVLNVQSDATFPYAWGRERAQLFLYSRPVNRINIRVFMHQETRFSFAEPNDLKGLSYCQPLGYQTEPELENMIEKNALQRFEARDMDGCFEMLSAKRVNFVISNDLVGRSSAERVLSAEMRSFIVAAEEPFRTISEYLIISKEHPDAEHLIDAFNTAYEVLLENGTLDRVWQRHLGAEAVAVD